MTFKELREQSGMTRTQFAEYFGIPYRTAQDWELGNRECKDYLIALMEYKLKHEGLMIDCAPAVDALPLRCRIGDTVWVVGTKCLSGLYEEECDSKCDNCDLDKEYMVFQRKVSAVLFIYIHDLSENDLFIWGKTVFLTREEAEAALAKLG